MSRSKLLASSALLEFDVVLKGRGYAEGERSREFLLLLRDHPESASAVHPIGPNTFVLASSIQERHGLDYFDSLVAAEAMQHDGEVVSSDREFGRVPGLRRVPLEPRT